MFNFKNQNDLIKTENLKLRLENHRLKEKIKNFENKIQIKSGFQTKILNKKFYKNFFIKFILITKNWYKMYKDFFYDNFNVLLKINQKCFLLDVIRLKKKISRAILFFVKYIDLIKFVGKIICKNFLIFSNFQKKFNFFKIFFNQILIQKFNIFYNIHNNKKKSIINSDFINIGSANLNFFISKLKILVNLIFNNPRNFINFVIVKKIREKNTKKIVNSSNLIFQLEKLKNDLLSWINFFLSKISRQKYNQLRNFNKLENLTLSMKYILDICFYNFHKSELKFYLISKKINNFSKKIRKIKKKIQKLYKSKLTFEKKKKNKQKREIVKKKLEYILLNRYKFHNSFCTMKQYLKLLHQVLSFEKFVCFLQLKTQITYQKLSIKHFFSAKMFKYFQLEKYKNRAIKKFLTYNFSSISKNVFFYRVCDIDKEIIILWSIVKLISFSRYNKFLLLKYLIKPKYLIFQNQNFKLKNKFNRIILILKHKIIEFQKNNLGLGKLLQLNNIKKNEIENKLHEIKSMEIDFSEILKNFKK